MVDTNIAPVLASTRGIDNMKSNDLPERVSDIIPEWVKEYSPNRGQEIADWYFRYHFWKVWDGKEQHLNEAQVVARAIAMAKMEALDQTVDIQVQSENANLYLLSEIDKNKWWRYLEYTDVREFFEETLQKIADRTPNAGAITEYRDLVTILDSIEKLGVPKEFIVTLPHNMSKARVASGPLKWTLESNAPPEEKAETVKNILAGVADRDVSVRDFRRKTREATGRLSHNSFSPAPAEFYILPKGKELLVIWSEGHKQTGLLQSVLNGVTTEIEIGDPTNLLKRITESVAPHSAGLVGHRLFNEGRLEPNYPGGFYLPTVERMQHIVLAELTKYLAILEQLDKWIYLLVFPLAKNIKPEEISDWIINNFGLAIKEEDKNKSLDILLEAARSMYSMPDTSDFYGGEVILRVDYIDGVLGIWLFVNGGHK